MSDVTMSSTGTAGSSSQSWGVGALVGAGLPNGVGSIVAEVNIEGELILRPCDALGAYFLQHFWKGKIQASWVGLPVEFDHMRAPERNSPQMGLREIRLRSEHGPLLSTGGDPHYTGCHVQPDDVPKLRALRDQLQEERSAAYRKAHPRKKPTPPTTKAKPKSPRRKP